MEKLKELVSIIPKQIQSIGHPFEKGTKLARLHEILREDKVNTDEEACGLLYEHQDKNAYYKLKHTLRNRLFNLLFFLEDKETSYSDIKKVKLACQKDLALYNLLITKGARQNALFIAAKGLKTALAYEFTFEALFFARQLQAHYATVSGSRLQFSKYNEIVQSQSGLLMAEMIVEGLFYELFSLYVNDKSTKPHVYKMAEQYLQQANKIKPKKESITFFYHKSMIEIIKWMSINDYTTALQIGAQALVKINGHKTLLTRGFITISLQMAACCIQLKKHRECEKIILKCLSIVGEGFHTWFTIQSIYFMLCFHTHQFEKARSVFQLSVRHRKFSSLPANAKEVWKIYEVWLRFLKEIGKLQADTHKRKSFRISKFINEVPTFSKDKRGLNISILVVQILFLLLQKKYDIILDRFESISKYKTRYLDKEHNFRSNVFIRMLLELPKANFKLKTVKQKTEKLSALLKEVPLEIANQSHDLEILPYEDAWQLILSLLDKKGK